MIRLLRTHADRRLARKIAAVRAFCALLLVAFAALLVVTAADGTMEVSSARTTARLAGTTVERTVAWTDAPLDFAYQLVGHLAIAAALVAALYVVLATAVERTHGRPLLPFRRRYPY